MDCLEHILFRTATLVDRDAISKAQLQHVLQGLLSVSISHPAGWTDIKTGKQLKAEPAELVKLNDWMHRNTDWFFYPDGIESDDDE